MTFKDLLLQLHNVKEEAKKIGLSQSQISNLKIVDIGILNSVEKKEYEASLAKDRLEFYVLLRLKK
ncbi:MAG TPA: hypothetical protein PKD00_08505 [Burkholderiales bacterium]|nr:hypothetical protein [Burkholderiales bacterium]